MELNSQYFSHPGYSYLLAALGEKYSARPTVYSAHLSRTFLSSLVFRLRAQFGVGKFLSYRGMGTKKFVKPMTDVRKRTDFFDSAQKIVLELKTKRQIEDLRIQQIHVGDLIYGAFIAAYREPTIKLNDPRLVRLVADFLHLLHYWKRYFDSNEVSAVVVSHLVYEMGVPARLALARGIECFHFADSGAALTRVASTSPFSGAEHKNFALDFLSLSEREQETGKSWAQRRLGLRFSGHGDDDLNSAAAAAYRTKESKNFDKILGEDDDFRVLVAGHLYWDSPHVLGKSLFPDYYEWLIFLGQASKDSDYSWYLKPHPDGKGQEDWMYREIVEEFPHLGLLPRDVTHHQIFAAGFDVALTVHGTIGLEYPLHGIPVVNASLAHPHVAFDFSVTPSSVDHYREILQNLTGIERGGSQDQILSYYFVKNIYYTSNIFFNDFQSDVRGSMSSNSPESLITWVRQLHPKKHKTLQMALRNFVNSEDSRLHWRHYGLTAPSEHLF